METKDDDQWPAAGVRKPSIRASWSSWVFQFGFKSISIFGLDMSWFHMQRVSLSSFSWHRIAFAGAGSCRTRRLWKPNVNIKYKSQQQTSGNYRIWKVVCPKASEFLSLQELQRRLQCLVGDALLSAAATELLGTYGPAAQHAKHAQHRRCRTWICHTESYCLSVCRIVEIKWIT
jgi:hypothetical protein